MNLRQSETVLTIFTFSKLKASLAFLKVILNNVSPSDLSVAGRSEGLYFFYKK